MFPTAVVFIDSISSYKKRYVGILNITVLFFKIR